MGSMIRHVVVNIRGVLGWSDDSLVGLFRDDDGKVMTAKDIRESLYDKLQDGYRVIAMGDECEGFDKVKGCPGHPVRETIYVSGKITGMPEDEARYKFVQAQRSLTDAGWKVINPFDIDLKEKEKTWANFMLADLEALATCHAIYMLDNWHDSNGAVIEHAFAKALGLKIYYQSSITVEDVRG